MATLLFNLRHVPDHEAEEVRVLLQANDIDCYETSAGSWRTSVPAIWLRDDTQLEQAQELLRGYQDERLDRVKTEFESLKQAGQHRTFWKNLRERPIRVIGSFGLVLLVLYLSIQLFVSMR